MQSNGGPGWPPSRVEHINFQQAPSRPASAASLSSAISSASSFRIPGIGLGTRSNTQPSNASTQHPVAAASVVRLFTPQPDEEDPLFYDGMDSSSPPVGWLSRDGPPPREFLESAQGPPPSILRMPQASGPFPQGSNSMMGPSAVARPIDQIRPFTASSYHRSKLVTADGSIGSYVCAILENKGIGREVGIASIDRETGTYQALLRSSREHKVLSH